LKKKKGCIKNFFLLFVVVVEHEGKKERNIQHQQKEEYIKASSISKNCLYKNINKQITLGWFCLRKISIISNNDPIFISLNKQ